MTEAEWLASTADPTAMLSFLQESGQASERKLRLFACAFCRVIWNSLCGDKCQRAVEVGEMLADSSFVLEELHAAQEETNEVLRLATDDRRYKYARIVFGIVCETCTVAEMDLGSAQAAKRAADWAIMAADSSALRAEQATLLRDIFGNPFRPIHLAPLLLTDAVVKLATSIYEERSLPTGVFDIERMDRLADLLEQEGCHEEGLIGHLRGPGPHVRGCHIVDLLLKKA